MNTDLLSNCSTGQMESAYNKNQLLRNKLERYVFLRSQRCEIVELPLEMCRESSKGSVLFEMQERNASWMDEFRPTAISCWKDVLALMHTVQGKIVNRITRNVMGTHDEFSCSFYVEKRTFWFYEVILDACRGTYWRTFSEFLSLQDWIWVQFVNHLMLRI